MAIVKLLHELADGGEPGNTGPEPALLAEALRTVMRGEASPGQVGALLMGLRCRAEQPEHLRAVAEVMLEYATPFPGAGTHEVLVDTCGTGGDHHGMVNVSTGTALLVAAAGVAVAKHGNRAVSSKSGSADVLEAFGLRIDVPAEHAAKLLAEYGFTFLFAPLYHPAMKHAGPVRRELKFRTIFNLAGPLSNPARPTHQLLGVPEARLLVPMARTLKLLGRKRALVVNGANGEDEISLTQVTRGLLVKEDGRLESFFLDPREFGMQVVEMAELTAADAPESAARLRRALEGEKGPVADILILNAGATLWLAGVEKTVKAGVEAAREVHRSARAAALLDVLTHASHQGAG